MKRPCTSLQSLTCLYWQSSRGLTCDLFFKQHSMSFLPINGHASQHALVQGLVGLTLAAPAPWGGSGVGQVRHGKGERQYQEYTC